MTNSFWRWLMEFWGLSSGRQCKEDREAEKLEWDKVKKAKKGKGIKGPPPP